MVLPIKEQASGVIEIKEHFPGMVGKIMEKHAVCYSQAWSMMDHTFDAQAGVELSQCLARLNPEQGELWTFRGLEAARRFYLGYGFKMTEENLVRQWGGNSTGRDNT